VAPVKAKVNSKPAVRNTVEKLLNKTCPKIIYNDAVDFN